MPNWTVEQFKAYETRQALDRRKASGTKFEPSFGDAPHADSAAKARHPRRRIVRITCYRAKRIQDPDNGIYKFHVDAIRHAGLVDDDTAEAIRLEIQPEVKVETLAEERTEIEIEKAAPEDAA